MSRENLERAVELINAGQVLRGPADYRKKVYDRRPAYAWAILRDMGFTEPDWGLRLFGLFSVSTSP